jgi:hypothetical protein
MTISVSPDAHATRADQMNSGRAQMHHVKVQAMQGDRCVVICADGLFILPVAAGCLLQPAPGDTVLASIADGEGYVIQVLARQGNTPARLHLQGDTELAVRDGRLRLTARTVDMQADVLSLRAQRLMETGTRRESHWDTRHEVIEHEQSFIARRELHMQRSVRRVAGHEEQSANSVRLIVTRDWRVRADTADLLGGRRVKVDADTVQLG